MSTDKQTTVRVQSRKSGTRDNLNLATELIAKQQHRSRSHRPDGTGLRGFKDRAGASP